MTEGILVRVISTKVAEGRLYEKKVKIINVLDRYSFEAVPVESSSRLDPSYTNLREKDLETVLPSSKRLDEGKSNYMLKILYGEHSGRTGKCLSIDKKRDKVVI